MGDAKEKVEKLIEQIRRERDELRVQASLAKLEAREDWQQLEARWHELQAKGKALGEATAESAEDIVKAAHMLAEEIRESLKRIRPQI